MPATQAAEVLRRELGVSNLNDVFESIDLDEPLGSASVSQACATAAGQLAHSYLFACLLFLYFFHGAGEGAGSEGMLALVQQDCSVCACKRQPGALV